VSALANSRYNFPIEALQKPEVTFFKPTNDIQTGMFDSRYGFAKLYTLMPNSCKMALRVLIISIISSSFIILSGSKGSKTRKFRIKNPIIKH
jgi:hypothetical protein